MLFVIHSGSSKLLLYVALPCTSLDAMFIARSAGGSDLEPLENVLYSAFLGQSMAAMGESTSRLFLVQTPDIDICAETIE